MQSASTQRTMQKDSVLGLSATSNKKFWLHDFLPSVGTALVVGAGLTACAAAPPPLRAAQAHFGPPAGDFWILSDAQFHNVAGESSRSKSTWADSLSEVAIRPASLDLWADVALSFVVDGMREQHPNTPAFFLGDAADVSCVGELAHFLATMRPALWFGVPGNHDGFYMGNFTYAPDPLSTLPVPNTWYGGCRRAGGIEPERHRKIAALEQAFLNHGTQKVGRSIDQGTLTKTHAVWLYLDDLRERRILTKDALDAAQWESTTDRPRAGKTRNIRVFRDTGFYVSQGHRYSVRVVAAIPLLTPGDEPSAWKAYVLQDVELPGNTHALLIDTTDYLNMPPSGLRGASALLQKVTGCRHSLSANSTPGICGEVNDHQINEAMSLVRKWDKEQRFFVLGHHSWEFFRANSITRLKCLTHDDRFVTYISGHTHKPSATVGYENSDQWELNVGSTTDWPMEYARIQYWRPEQSQERWTDLRVDVRALASTVVSLPSDAACPAKDLEAELDYDSIEKYANRALHVYTKILEATPLSEQIVLEAAAKQQHMVCSTRNECFANHIASANAALGLGQDDLGQKLDELALLIKFDRSVLRKSNWVRRAELSCAVAASWREFRKNFPAGIPPLDMSTPFTTEGTGATFRLQTSPR